MDSNLSATTTTTATTATLDFANPILEKCEIRNHNEHWIPGNRSLLNLNLSRNQITNKGVELLCNSVSFQVDYAHENGIRKAVGVMRISLRNNSFDSSDPVHVKLNHLLDSRDPTRTISDNVS